MACRNSHKRGDVMPLVSASTTKKAGSLVEELIRDGVTAGLIGLGGAVGGGGLMGAVGSLVGAYVGNKWIVKDETHKKVLWVFSIINAADLFMEMFMPRGIIG